jgi:methionyl-tRNA formyltransferase
MSRDSIDKRELSFVVLAKRKPGLASCLNFLKSRSAHVEVFVGKRGDPFPALPASDGQRDVVISYLAPWVVPPVVLKRARVAAINFHPGPPEYPGIGCTNFALYHHARVYGVTAHHMAERVDTGRIIAVRRFPVHDHDTVLTLTRRCYDHLPILFKDVIGTYLSTGRFPASEERWARKPYTRRDLERLCEVRMDMPPEEVKRRIHATAYPGMPGVFITPHGGAHA